MLYQNMFAANQHYSEYCWPNYSIIDFLCSKPNIFGIFGAFIAHVLPLNLQHCFFFFPIASWYLALHHGGHNWAQGHCHHLANWNVDLFIAITTLMYAVVYCHLSTLHIRAAPSLHRKLVQNWKLNSELDHFCWWQIICVLFYFQDLY